MPVTLLPIREAERRLFLQNVVDVTDKVEQMMKVPAGTYQPMKDAAQAELDAFGTRDNARTAADTADTNLKTVAKTSGLTVRGTLKEIKNTLNVPTSVIDLLKLNGPASKPQEKARAETPQLSVLMKGITPTVKGARYNYDSVEIWCCRGAETEHTLLDVITHFPYADPRPNLVPDQPENRSYYGRYKKRNVVVSGQGPTVDLTVPSGTHQ